MLWGGYRDLGYLFAKTESRMWKVKLLYKISLEILGSNNGGSVPSAEAVCPGRQSCTFREVKGMDSNALESR